MASQEVRSEGLLIVRTNSDGNESFPIKSAKSLIITSCYNKLKQWRVSATINLVTRTSWWHTMRRNVRDFVQPCQMCQLDKKDKKMMYIHHQPVNYFIDTLSIDISGALPKTRRK